MRGTVLLFLCAFVAISAAVQRNPTEIQFSTPDPNNPLNLNACIDGNPATYCSSGNQSFPYVDMYFTGFSSEEPFSLTSLTLVPRDGDYALFQNIVLLVKTTPFTNNWNTLYPMGTGISYDLVCAFYFAGGQLAFEAMIQEAEQQSDGAALNLVNEVSPGLCVGPINETETFSLKCPSANQYITSVQFASYGTPTGTCGIYQIDSECNSGSAQGVFEANCLNKNQCSFVVDNTVLGPDPCPNVYKHFIAEATCTAYTMTTTETNDVWQYSFDPLGLYSVIPPGTEIIVRAILNTYSPQIFYLGDILAEFEIATPAAPSTSTSKNTVIDSGGGDIHTSSPVSQRGGDGGGSGSVPQDATLSAAHSFE